MTCGILGVVMNDEVHPRREALAGGEEGNGIELWRVLCREHEGRAQQVYIHYIKDFHTSPQCKNLKGLPTHICELQNSRARYANNMPAEHLREFCPSDPPGRPSS